MKLTCLLFIFLQISLFADKSPANILFLVGERLNSSTVSMPSWAASLENQFNYKTEYISIPKYGSATGLNKIKNADLLIIYLRFRNIPKKQIKLINQHLDSGKPAIALRTSSHAFTHQPGWFYKYFGGDFREAVSSKGSINCVLPDQQNHPIIAQIKTFRSDSSLYLSGPLHKNATPLLMGYSQNSPETPTAWTCIRKQQRLFYTSLGRGTDFKKASFKTLLNNAVHWCLNKNLSIAVNKKNETIPAPPAINAPEGAQILFDGRNLDKWKSWDLLNKPISYHVG
ncbi:MAG: ThuA domain-containing protein, partial [Lentisphaeraceae bacterium]|nr:ThuA domain-containing protein [Lentisphaeraceae bacterium]